MLGYRIEYLAHQREYRLRSMFAEPGSDDDDDNVLLFRRARDGSIQVIETRFITELPASTLDSLHTSSSIPVFLAHVTLAMWRQRSCPS